MSKSTKIIAAIGVVAGLGIAALPAFTYATETVSGEVDLYVEVQPAIAMTIVGNNDDTDGEGTDSAQIYTTDPVTTGVDVYTPSGASTIDGHTVGALYDSTNLQTSGSYTSLLPNAKVEGSSANGFRSTITVYTNNASGYVLAVKDSDSTLALTNGDYTIPATSGTLAAGTAGWNYDVIRHGATADSTFAPTEAGDTEELTGQAITASDVQIDNWTAKTSSGRDTIVDYNVATAADQATGVYSDTIVYTATTKN